MIQVVTKIIFFLRVGALDMGDTDENVTTLLTLMADGDDAASDRLMRFIYNELRAVASKKLCQSRSESTLTPTVLIHEAYNRVIAGAVLLPTNRRHFFFAFARAMWQIVVENRRRMRLPRSAQDVDILPAVINSSTDELLDLDDAMHHLRIVNRRSYEVAILRKSLGLTQVETATLLGTSQATVRRDWTFAKAWLSRYMTKERQRTDGSNS